jgi:hypothetical protein
VASELRSLNPSPELRDLGRPSEQVPVRPLSTRGVVAFRKRRLRSVASECGQRPKDVLSGTFQKLRRAASTRTSMRMSWRFARTTRHGLVREPLAGAAPEEWAWRSVGDVVLDVLRGGAVPTGTEPGTKTR